MHNVHLCESIEFHEFESTVGYDIFGFESFPGFGIDPLTFDLEVFFLRSASSGSVNRNKDLHEIQNNGRKCHSAPREAKITTSLRDERKI